jgi:hypothetical protein
MAILIQGFGLLCVGVWGTIRAYQEFGCVCGPAPWFAGIGLLELVIFLPCFFQRS